MVRIVKMIRRMYNLSNIICFTLYWTLEIYRCCNYRLNYYCYILDEYFSRIDWCWIFFLFIVLRATCIILYNIVHDNELCLQNVLPQLSCTHFVRCRHVVPYIFNIIIAGLYTHVSPTMSFVADVLFSTLHTIRRPYYILLCSNMTLTRTADVAVIIHNTYVYIYIYISPLLNNITTMHTLYEIVTWPKSKYRWQGSSEDFTQYMSPL